MSHIEKEKLIKEDLASIENRVRHAFNQGYDLGFKDGKEKAKPLEQELCEDWYDVPSDEMTLGQARQAVKDLRKKLSEHLEQEPTTKNDLGVDCISRQAVIDKTGLSEWFDSSDSYNEFVFALNELPSVTPQEPKTGYWYIDERPESNREVICSNCEQPIFKYHKLDFDYRPKYCPNCGARMVEPQESEDKE